MKTGDLLWVAWAKKVGQVRYITADGWVGVALVNEQGRTDEWQSWQVEVVTPEAAAALVLKAG